VLHDVQDIDADCHGVRGRLTVLDRTTVAGPREGAAGHVDGRPHPLSESLGGGRPLVCGVLNVTPDSFSDGGRFLRPEVAVRRGCRLADEGADLIDVGGESTRPGSRQPTVEQEIDRVVPVVEALAARVAVPLSVDTSRPEVMRAAVAAGASMINDVRALRQPGALQAAADLGVPVALMHMQRSPLDMQHAPHYGDVVAEVHRFLAERIRACLDAGISREHLVVDPGFGFGKTLPHNLALLASLAQFRSLGAPIMVGLSRKSMLGELTGRTVGERLAGSVTAAVLAVQRGASLVRVHDVAVTRDALAVLQALPAG
jgi:dihydropteroate synthase